MSCVGPTVLCGFTCRPAALMIECKISRASWHLFLSVEMMIQSSTYTMAHPKCLILSLMHCWSKFFRADILMANKVVFNERLSQLEDVDFVCSYLRWSESRIYVDAPGLCHTVNDSSENLSSQSGAGKGACEKLVTALSAADGLKKHLLDHCRRDEVVSFEHFICSMSVLFCMRIGRQFWRSPAWSLVAQIYRWLSFEFIRDCARAFRHVPGESRLLAFSLRRFPPLMSTVILLCLRR